MTRMNTDGKPNFTAKNAENAKGNKRMMPVHGEQPSNGRALHSVRAVVGNPGAGAHGVTRPTLGF